jgi:hypothetical protein
MSAALPLPPAPAPRQPFFCHSANGHGKGGDGRRADREQVGAEDDDTTPTDVTAARRYSADEERTKSQPALLCSAVYGSCSASTFETKSIGADISAFSFLFFSFLFY